MHFLSIELQIGPTQQGYEKKKLVLALFSFTGNDQSNEQRTDYSYRVACGCIALTHPCLAQHDEDVKCSVILGNNLFFITMSINIIHYESRSVFIFVNKKLHWTFLCGSHSTSMCQPMLM